MHAKARKTIDILLFGMGMPVLAWTHYAFLLPLEEWAIPGIILFSVLPYVLLRGILPLRFAAKVNAAALCLYSLCLMIVMLIDSGSLTGAAFRYGFCFAAFPFLPLSCLLNYVQFGRLIPICVLLTYASALGACLFLSGKAGTDAAETRDRPKGIRVLPYLVAAVVFLVCGGVSLNQYLNRPEIRYAGHGFTYMHGFSSTDFTDYTVYAEPSGLVLLDHPPAFTIENEKDMPVMDGAEACYPLYAAFAKAVYRDIDRIERDAAKSDDLYTNGKIVTFTNTVQGFYRLLNGEADLFFGAKPSRDQLNDAALEGVPLTVTPIGREGFVFFTEEDNPVDNLSSEQIRAIYHGDITNWKEVGGKNQTISAFQRPKNSGSQTMMEYFMGDVSLKEPKTYETIDSMVGVIRNVAQYSNEAGAMGYSFRYFLEGLNQEKGVKLLSVDGVAPTLENIENGSYPLTVGLCLVTRADDPNPNVQRMIDFILSEDGQEIVRRTGYAGLSPQN